MFRLTTARASTFVAASRPRVALSSVVGSRAASHDSHASAADSEHYPEEGFNASFWQYGSIGVIGAFIAYRLTPDAAKPSASADDKPYVTRFIEKNIMPAENLWKERNEKHLELSKIQAEDKLLFQEAERPKVRRIRYTGTFEQASPHALSTGTQADLSDLVIKSEKDDFKA